uniref:Palmitoyltransferase n=1 Tax=Panagrellus redivivus TaxID=6233 RepID=A0A7E4ZXI9_PANRE
MGVRSYIIDKFYQFQSYNFNNFDLRRIDFSDLAKKWMLFIVNGTGMLFTVTLLYGATWFGYTYILPDIYPEHKNFFFWLAMFLIGEITANLLCFHMANRKNRVSYWVVKSSYMFNESEQAMLYGDLVPRQSDPNYEKPVSITVPETQRLIMDDRSSESIKCPPAPFPRLDFRDPILGGDYTDDGVLIPPLQDMSHTRFCEECNCICPRRSHHCPICDYCVLRKDHHCFFTGGCVGLANQRYFIVFLLHTTIGASIVVYLLGLYLNNHVAPMFPFGFLRFLGPVVGLRWIFGYDDLFVCICGTLLTFSVSITFGAAGFFVANIYYMLNGYTMHDYHTGRLKNAVECDGEDYTERIALIFGKHWALNFLFPLYWNPNILTPAIARNILLAGSKDL